MHTDRDIATATCPSVTHWYCNETNAHIVKLFPPTGRGMTLSFFQRYSVTKFLGELP